MAPALKKYDWILAITTIAFVASSASNGANDVANSYATSVAARTLKMWQAGILACFTEFLGAVALGSRVTGTIKSGIFALDTFKPVPATLMLAMGCAEVGSAVFLTVATIAGMPVSTTQTVVGALAGAGIAAQSPLSWGWKKGSISQIAASWVIAPFLSAAFAAVLFLTIKFAVHNRKDPFKWAMRLIPFYLAFTAGVLALFIIDELPNGESLEEMGAGKACGIILGVFFGMLAISYIFFIPYFTRRLVKGDTRLRAWHLPLGPLLYRENPPIYFPGKGDQVVTDYYAKSAPVATSEQENLKGEKPIGHSTSVDNKSSGDSDNIDVEGGRGLSRPLPRDGAVAHIIPAKPEPEERWLKPVEHLPFYSPKKIMNWTKFILLQGVSRDVVTQKDLADVHSRAIVYDNRVEHLWTYAQVASAMMMSIAHGSNDGKSNSCILHLDASANLTSQLPTLSDPGLVLTTPTPLVSSPRKPTLPSGSSSSPVFFLVSVSGSTDTTSYALSVTRSLKSLPPVDSAWNWVPPLLSSSPRVSLSLSPLLSASLAPPSVSRFATSISRPSTGSKSASSSPGGSSPCLVQVSSQVL